MHNSTLRLIGQKFGDLEVISVEKHPTRAGNITVCRCSCGKEARIRPDGLLNGHHKSCGCKAKFKHKPVIGKRFSFLEITGESFIRKPNGDKRYFVICKCHNCGKNSFRTDKQSVVNGLTTSCGCRKDQYSKITGKNSSQFTGYEDISGHTWSLIKRRAFQRDVSFEITIKDAWDRYQQQKGKCALTGLPLTLFPNTCITASLDRIDSSKGYTLDNIQWVLKAVNIMKNSYSMEFFINICRKIVLQHEKSPAVSDKFLTDIRWNNHTGATKHVL